jgi:hypothetical protein
LGDLGPEFVVEIADAFGDGSDCGEKVRIGGALERVAGCAGVERLLDGARFGARGRIGGHALRG